MNVSECVAADELTLLDGELIRHIDTNKVTFIVFDIVVRNGRPVATFNLSERLKAVGEVVKDYRKGIVEKKYEEDDLPMILVGKVFFAKGDMYKTFVNNVKDLGNGVRVFKDHRRYSCYCVSFLFFFFLFVFLLPFSCLPPPNFIHFPCFLLLLLLFFCYFCSHHRTDGIIITPLSQPYHPRSETPILKWKYPDLLTVDFKMKYNQQQKSWQFCAVGMNGEDVYCLEVNLSESDAERLSRDMQVNDASKGESYNNIIVELSYSRVEGRWKYLQLRSDKKKANYIRTVFQTLEAMIEDVSLEEFIYRLSRPLERDDWNAKMDRVKHDLLHHDFRKHQQQKQMQKQQQQQKQKQQQQQQPQKVKAGKKPEEKHE